MIRFLQSGNKAAKYILGGFLLILAASMVTYLIPGFMSSAEVNRAGVVAKVGSEEIATDEVRKMASQQLQQQHYPQQLAPFITQQVLQRMIQRAELRYEAQRLGFTVSDEELREDLQNGQYKQYFFPDGKWIGQQAYENLVTQGGQTVAEFERDQKDGLLLRKLLGTVTAGVNVSPAELENAYKQKNTKVKFQYAVLNLQDISKQITPTEAELKAFYTANLARYQNSIPEKRQVKYFVLQDKDAESKITVDPSEITRSYAANREQYRLPERVKLRRILIKTTTGPDGNPDPKSVETAKAKAADVFQQAKSGADFASLAKKYSQDELTSQQGGELGWIVKGQFPYPEAEKVAFSQSNGQISAPLQTPLGFDIIKTEEKETAHVKPLAEVRDTIEKALKEQKAAAFLQQMVNNAEETAKKDGLEKAASKAGAQVITSNPIARSETLPGVGPSPDVMSAVFAASQKDPPQSVRFGTGYVLFQVAGIVPPKTPSFEEIKDRVTSDFKSQRGNELLQKKTQELADRAHAEHDLAKAAKEAGTTVKTSDLVDKSSQVPALGPMGGQLSAAFNLKPGEISGAINLGQKGVVLAVTDRQEPSTSDPQFAKDRDSLQEQLSEQKRQEALEIFVSNLGDRLKKEGRIKVNPNAANLLTKSRS